MWGTLKCEELLYYFIDQLYYYVTYRLKAIGMVGSLRYHCCIQLYVTTIYCMTEKENILMSMANFRTCFWNQFPTISPNTITNCYCFFVNTSLVISERKPKASLKNRSKLVSYRQHYTTAIEAIVCTFYGAKTHRYHHHEYIYGLAQDCSNSSALTMELLPPCAKTSMSSLTKT